MFSVALGELCQVRRINTDDAIGLIFKIGLGDKLGAWIE